MSLYRYRAKDRKGHKYKGIREGENEAQLVKSLAEDGLYCYFLQNEDRVVSMRHFTVPLKWLPPFCSQVSSMLSSGVPQSDILKTACKTAPTREMKALLARLEEKIHRGQTLSEAMGSMGKCFPKLLIYMIQTGEASGTLDDILQKMSVYYAKEVEMEGKVRTGTVDIDEQPELEERFDISTIPSLILFQAGKNGSTLVNPPSRGAIMNWLKEQGI